MTVRAESLPTPFADALAADRDALNVRFQRRRQAGASIDALAFLEHVRTGLAPLIGQVHGIAPDRVRPVTVALYDVALDLFAAGLLGPEPKHPFVQQVWTQLLPRVPRLLAQRPQETAACLCNAVHHVAQHHGSRPQVWIELLSTIAESAEDLNVLLLAGRVAAWQAGLVQYRTAALEALSAVPLDWRWRLLGAPDAWSEGEWLQIERRLIRHPWYDAAGAAVEPSNIAVVAQAGAFCGYGGPFRQPPRVMLNGDRIRVSDGESCWRLHADAFGTCFQRVNDQPGRKSRVQNAEVTFTSHGRLQWGSLKMHLPWLADATSHACDGETLAVTLRTSYRVFLLARRGGEV